MRSPLTAIAIPWLCAASAAQSPDPVYPAELRAIEPLVPEAVRKRPLVAFHTGHVVPTIGTEVAIGWVLEESDTDVRLFDRLMIERHLRPGDANMAECAAAGLQPGETHEIEIEPILQALRRGRPGPLHLLDIWKLEPELDAVTLAYHCWHRGDRVSANRLLAWADENWSRRSNRPLHESLIECATRRLEFVASSLATAGAAHAELAQIWREIARLPGNTNRALAERLTEIYELMDDQPAPPSDSEDPRRWIESLCDMHVAVPRTAPSPILLLEKKADAPEPIEKLRALGWAAIPALVEHLDDMRPTRSFAFGERKVANGDHLLRVADCCDAVLFTITGARFHADRPPSIFQREPRRWTVTRGADAVAAKTRAIVWWKRLGHLDHERFHAVSLSSRAPRQVIFSALELRNRHRNPAGRAVLAHMVRDWDAERHEQNDWFPTYAIMVLAQWKDATAEDHVAEFTKHEMSAVRACALRAGMRFRTRAMLAALVPHLDDVSKGISKGMRVCDEAAHSIARIVELEFQYGSERELQDQLIEDLREWLVENPEWQPR